MSPEQRQYLHQLGSLHHRASTGDPRAYRQMVHIGELAEVGHPPAVHAFHTLARIHQARKRNRVRVRPNAADALYHRLRQGDPLAKSQLRRIVQGARTGSLAATSLFGSLQAAHRKHKASMWFGPGAPRTGHYPMPAHHRPGIFIGAASFQPLTEFALTRLLALIAQARVSAPGTQYQDFGAPPDPAPGGSMSNPYGKAIFATPAPAVKTVAVAPAIKSVMRRLAVAAPKPTVRRFLSSASATPTSLFRVR